MCRIQIQQILTQLHERNLEQRETTEKCKEFACRNCCATQQYCSREQHHESQRRVSISECVNYKADALAGTGCCTLLDVELCPARERARFSRTGAQLGDALQHFIRHARELAVEQRSFTKWRELLPASDHQRNDINECQCQADAGQPAVIAEQ